MSKLPSDTKIFVVLILFHYTLGFVTEGFGVLIFYSIFKMLHFAGTKEIFYISLVVEPLWLLTLFMNRTIIKLYGLLKLLLSLFLILLIVVEVILMVKTGSSDGSLKIIVWFMITASGFGLFYYSFTKNLQLK